MSLIADALKAAQMEKQQRPGEEDSLARSVISSPARSAPPSPGRSGAGWLGAGAVKVTRPVGIAAGLFVSALAITVAVITTAPEASPRPDAQRRSVEAPVVDEAPISPAATPEGDGEAGTAAAEAPPAGADVTVAASPAEDAPDHPASGSGGTSAEPGPSEPPPAARRSGTPPRAVRQQSSAPAPATARRAPAAAPLAAAPAPVAAPDPREQQREAQRLFAEGLVAQRRGDLAAAVARYRQAIALDPRNAELYNNLGTALHAQGAAGEARAQYEQALALRPDYAAAWSNLGVALTTLGADAEARTALAQALRHDPGNVGARVNLAIQYHAQGVPGEAKRLLEEALRADPTLPEAHYALARLLDEAGDRAGAAQHFSLFLSNAGGRFPQLEPRVREYLDRLRRP